MQFSRLEIGLEAAGALRRECSNRAEKAKSRSAKIRNQVQPGRRAGDWRDQLRTIMGDLRSADKPGNVAGTLPVPSAEGLAGTVPRAACGSSAWLRHTECAYSFGSYPRWA